MARKPKVMAAAAATAGARKPKRVEIKKIETEEERLVCFSKRKSGLFSKANEISTLCGVQVLLVIFSLAGNPYSFGCPTVQPLIDRFLSDTAAIKDDQQASPPKDDHEDELDDDDDDDGAGDDKIEQLNGYIRDLATKVERGKEKKLILEKQLRTAIQQSRFARMLMSPVMEESSIWEIAAKLGEVKLNLQEQLQINENMGAAAAAPAMSSASVNNTAASSSSNPPPLMANAIKEKKKSSISSAVDDHHLAASSDQRLIMISSGLDLNQTPLARSQINELTLGSGGCFSFDLNKVPDDNDA